MDKGTLSIGLLTILVIGIIVAIAAASPEGKPPLGQEIPEQGRDHIVVGSTHDAYNSNPPTSGPHYPEPAPWGIKAEPLTDETLVHNLEHGGIWISYQPDKVNKETIDQLTRLASTYRSKVILAPRRENDTPIALASWGRLLKLDAYDETITKDFIARNKNKAPEFFPD